MKEESKKYLPGPFCGGEPEIKQTGRNQLRIRCKSCLVGIEQKVLRFSLEWLEVKLADIWNTRVPVETTAV
jgi:hypothetical protein